MQFCYNYISTGNAMESAVRAGYTSCPWQVGAKLLLDPNINEQIHALYEEKKRLLYINLAVDMKDLLLEAFLMLLDFYILMTPIHKS